MSIATFDTEIKIIAMLIKVTNINSDNGDVLIQNAVINLIKLDQISVRPF